MSSNVTFLYPALFPLYDFSHWFLGSILQTTTLDDIADDLDLSDPGKIIAEFSSEWQFWANYFLGFMILAALGITFIIFYTLSGICTCSCRVCCGNCGAEGGKKHSKCKYVCCSTSLFCLVTIILFGVIWSVLANYALWDTTKEGHGALHELQTDFASIDLYRQTTTDEIEQSVLWNFATTKNTIYSILDNAGPSIIRKVSEATNAGPALDNLQLWTNGLPELQAALQEAEETVAALQANGNQLQAELATLKTDVSTDASLCRDFEQLCADLEVLAANIGMGVDYDDLEGSQISLALISVTYAIDDDIWGSVQSGIDEYLAVGDDINVLLGPIILDIKTSVNTLETELTEYTELIINAMDKLNMSTIISKLAEVEPQVEEYGVYWYWSCISLSCVLGVIVLCYYWGLFLGTCCKKSTCCSRKTASKCLISANCCSFLFGWLLMVVTTACFLLGGPGYTEVCRHLMNPQASSTLKRVDGVLTDALGFNLSVADTFAKCRNNSPAYIALDLERYGINISEILDLDQYNVKDTLDAIKSIKIDVGTVDILTQQANETLQVTAAGLNAINATSFYIVLEKEVVSQDLAELADALDAAADAISVGTLKEQFQIQANTSRELNTGLVQTINDDKQTLYNTIILIEQQKNAIPVNDLITNLSNAQNTLNNHGNQYISGVLNSSVDELYSVMKTGLDQLETTITEDIGKCGDLYAALDDIIIVTCVHVLDPLNAFWLSYGWSLWLLIPCVAIAYSLSGHYRASMEIYLAEAENYRQFENSDVESTPPTPGKGKQSAALSDPAGPSAPVIHVKPKRNSIDWDKAGTLS